MGQASLMPPTFQGKKMRKKGVSQPAPLFPPLSAVASSERSPLIFPGYMDALGNTPV